MIKKLLLSILCLNVLSGAFAFADKLREKPALDINLENTNNIRTVFKINTPREKDGVNRGLYYVRSVVKQYEDLGIPLSNLKMSAVLLGDAMDALMKGKKKGNNQVLVKDLIAKGVSIEICRESMFARKIESSDLIEGVKVVPSAFLRVIDLQQSGYAWVAVTG